MSATKTTAQHDQGVPRLARILVAEGRGAPMQDCRTAQAVAGRGLVGDRYWAGCGTFSGRSEVWAGAREISMIDTAAVAECNRRLACAGSPGVDAAALRRNLVIDELDLMTPGRSWLRIDAVEFEILGTCPPCGYLSRLLDQDMRRALYRIGGVRARVHVGGALNRGAAVEVMDDAGWRRK